MGGFWVTKYGKEWCDVDPNKLVFSFGGSYVHAILVKIIKECDRESTNRTDRQMQSSFVICSLLYAVAMGQIIINTHTNTPVCCPSAPSPPPV